MSEAIPEDLMEKARKIAENYLKGPLRELLAQEVGLALVDERAKCGGAAATTYDGKIVVIHPEFPPHVWNGYKMEPIGIPYRG